MGVSVVGRVHEANPVSGSIGYSKRAKPDYQIVSVWHYHDDLVPDAQAQLRPGTLQNDVAVACGTHIATFASRPAPSNPHKHPCDKGNRVAEHRAAPALAHRDARWIAPHALTSGESGTRRVTQPPPAPRRPRGGRYSRARLSPPAQHRPPPSSRLSALPRR